VPGIVGVVSPRARVGALVAVAAVAAAGVTIAATMLTATDETRNASPQPRLRPGAPPIVLDLGVRTDAEARALRRAIALAGKRRRAAAERIFARYGSVEAQVGRAMASWPQGASRLEALARDRPRSGAVQLNLGLARFWERDHRGARRAWRAAKRFEPDSTYAVRAGDLLHPEYPVPGLPVFVPSFGLPAALDRLQPPAQLRYLERRAGRGGVRDRLLYGVALQRLGRPVSARREFAAAAALAPKDVEASTAAAVGRFDKDRPQDAFSRLGPLARQYPRAATIRFHLGLMLLWMGDVGEAKVQFRRAIAADPGSVPAKQAQAFLDRLG